MAYENNFTLYPTVDPRDFLSVWEEFADVDSAIKYKVLRYIGGDHDSLTYVKTFQTVTDSTRLLELAFNYIHIGNTGSSISKSGLPQLTLESLYRAYSQTLINLNLMYEARAYAIALNTTSVGLIDKLGEVEKQLDTEHKSLNAWIAEYNALHISYNKLSNNNVALGEVIVKLQKELEEVKAQYQKSLQQPAINWFPDQTFVNPVNYWNMVNIPVVNGTPYLDGSGVGTISDGIYLH